MKTTYEKKTTNEKEKDGEEKPKSKLCNDTRICGMEIPKNTKENRYRFCYGHYFLAMSAINLIS